MTDYKKGLIYTIRSPHTDNIYIGSTCQRLSKRLYAHKSNFRKYKNGATKYITSYKILEFGDAYIELLESYPCNNKIELCKREGEVIREYKNICVNKYIAGKTLKKYYQENKEQVKQYYQENKEQIKEKKKQYYQENKEQVKQCYQENKEKRKQHYHKNKERHYCECGGHYFLRSKSNHEKTN